MIFIACLFETRHVFVVGLSVTVKKYVIIENVFYFVKSKCMISNLNNKERYRRLVNVNSHLQRTNSDWRGSNFVVISFAICW